MDSKNDFNDSNPSKDATDAPPAVSANAENSVTANASSSGDPCPTNNAEYADSQEPPDSTNVDASADHVETDKENADANTHNKNIVSSDSKASSEHISSPLTIILSSNKTPGCTCKKSKCLKLYCQCFAASAFCNPDICKCESCKNEVSNEKDIKRARSNVLYRNPRAFEGKFIENKAQVAPGSNKHAMDNGGNVNGNMNANGGPNSGGAMNASNNINMNGNSNAGGRPIQPYGQMPNGELQMLFGNVRLP